jgi:hypothetical protein
MTFVQRLRNRLSQLRQRAELARLNEDEVRALAQDVGLAPGGLRELVSGNPYAAELLPRRMATLGLDPEALALAAPEATRDLQRVCSTCESYGRCRIDLDRDPDDILWQWYCPNAGTLRELQAAPSAAG